MEYFFTPHPSTQTHRGQAWAESTRRIWWWLPSPSEWFECVLLQNDLAPLLACLGAQQQSKGLFLVGFMWSLWRRWREVSNCVRQPSRLPSPCGCWKLKPHVSTPASSVFSFIRAVVLDLPRAATLYCSSSCCDGSHYKIFNCHFITVNFLLLWLTM